MRVKDAALLNCLMYYDGMVFKNGKSISENINGMQQKEKKEWQKMMRKCLSELEGDKAEAIINAILEDETLSNLKVLDCTRKTPYEEGPIIACFLDERNKTAIFAFRGTNGKEWMDNAEGFLLESSRMQIHALKYVEDTIAKYGLVEKGYAIDVTGHSKGGNKAQYVTIKCPDIRECYSYDGQGFSPIFLKENKEAIQKNQHKITTIAAHQDYVHSLAHDIAGKSKWYQTNEHPDQKISSAKGVLVNIALKIKGIKIAFAHSAGAIFHFDNGQFQLNTETKRAEFSDKLHQMTLDLFNCSKEDQTMYFMSMMGVLQALKTNEPIHLSSMLSYDEIKGGVRKLVSYLTKDKDKSILRDFLQSKTFGKLYNMAMENMSRKRKEIVREVLPKEKCEPKTFGIEYEIYQDKDNPKKIFIGTEIEDGKLARLSPYSRSEEKCRERYDVIREDDPFSKKQSRAEYEKFKKVEKEVEELRPKPRREPIDISWLLSRNSIDRSERSKPKEHTPTKPVKRAVGDMER